MTHDELEYVRKAWPRWRGRINWRSQRHFYLVQRPDISVSDWSPGDAPSLVSVKRFLITAESVGWNHHGDIYEWWNIICDGRIIDMEWYEK